MYASTNKMASRYRELLEGLEQRSHERVNLALECRVSTGNKRSAGTMKVVENISRTGILIETSSKVPADTPIEITFMLRRKGDTPMQVTAHVVRVEEAEGATPRIAARFAAQMGLEIFQRPARA